jgi:hypothetical protein
LIYILREYRLICSSDTLILHTKDYVTKFSWAYPLESNETEVIAEKLLQQFYLFGAPRILQSNNGKEFVAKVTKVLSPPFCFYCTTIQ